MKDNFSTPTTPLTTRRSTRTGLPPLRPYFGEAWGYRSFAIYWSRAEVKARNFETFFGRVWHFINPFLFGLIYFVFVGIVGGGGFDDMERLALIVGNLYVWVFLSTTISTGVGAVQVGSGGILAQSAIPRIVLPAAAAITSGNLFLRSLIAYVPLHIVARRGLHLEMLLIPYLVLLTAITALGLALLFAVANVYFRDVSRLLPHALRLWMYLSPVIWAYPRALEGAELAQLNPMFHGIGAWTIAYGGSLSSSGPSLLAMMIVFTLFAVSCLAAGVLAFLYREDEFAVRN